MTTRSENFTSIAALAISSALALWTMVIEPRSTSTEKRVADLKMEVTDLNDKIFNLQRDCLRKDDAPNQSMERKHRTDTGPDQGNLRDAGTISPVARGD